MAPEDLEYFDDLEATFGTHGWKTLIEEAKKKIYEYQAAALECTSWDQVNILRGRALQLQDLVNLQDVMELARKNIEAEEVEADAAV